jgi:hypothetical protein
MGRLALTGLSFKSQTAEPLGKGDVSVSREFIAVGHLARVSSPLQLARALGYS